MNTAGEEVKRLNPVSCTSQRGERMWLAGNVYVLLIHDLETYEKRRSSGEHVIHWTCALCFHIARKMNNVRIFSDDIVTHIMT